MRHLRFQCACAILLFALPVMGATVTFPPTNDTSPTCQIGFVADTPGVDNGTVYFYWGGFFNNNGVEWFGAGGCGNFFALQFGPKATGVSVRLHNLGAAKTITVGTSAGLIAYALPAHGDQTIIDPGPTIGMNFQSDTDGVFAITSLSIDHQQSPTSPSYQLWLRVYTDPGNPGVDAAPITAGKPISAQLALGSVFSVGVVKRTPNPSGQPATLTDIVSTYTKSADKIAPALETQVNLFDSSPVIQLAPGPTTAVTQLEYAAVHLGTVTFTLTPFDAGAPASVTLNLTIVRPTALGGEHNDWDKAIIDAAHERGIPPQILKGQIRQESPNFDQDEIRYEPCSWDFDSISRGATLINTTPYSLYALDGALNDPALNETIDLRNRYLVNIGTTTRFLIHTDTQISARAIWEANDGPLTQQGYDLGAEDENWSLIKCSARDKYLAAGHTPAQFLAALGSFVAQTPTASSYGVMQVMYGTAVQSPIKWFVPNPGRNVPGCPTTTDNCQSPRYLRDTHESLVLTHGGSLFVGGHKDVQLYWDFGPTASGFISQDDFVGSFIKPLKNYTGGGIADYGKNIIDLYQYDYLPDQPSAIFP